MKMVIMERMLINIKAISVIMSILSFGRLLSAPPSMQAMMISVSVADLRAEPHKAQVIKAPALSLDNKGQISQLLYGEPIYAQQDIKNPGWLIVEALGHMHYSNGKWINLRGYIQDFQAILSKSKPVLVAIEPWVAVYIDKKKSKVLLNVPFGSRLVGKKLFGNKDGWLLYEVMLHDGQRGFVEYFSVYHVKKNIKQSWERIGSRLASCAQQFVGCPYVWGGRTPHNSLIIDQITGYDCSALIHTIYQSYGLRIPRNSHNQFLYAMPLCSGIELQPGDCLFFGRLGLYGACMRHVMMYLGDGKLLDSAGLSYKSVFQAPDPKQLATRVLTVQQATGVSLQKLTNKMVCLTGTRKGDSVFLGTYRSMLQKLRSDFLV